MAKVPEKSHENLEMNAVRDQSLEVGKQSPKVGVGPLSSRTDDQWKTIFYENVQQRALNFQNVKMKMFHKHKARQEKAEKKVPPDGLSREWFVDEGMSLETRAYLLDKLLPTLMPGVEKLLKVAERKKVLEAEEEPPLKFNPINFLGEYLMRCNPSYDLSTLSNPYVRGIKAVTEEVKTQVPETILYRQAQMKALVKEKRKQREEMEQIKNHVKEMRKNALAVQFREWTLDVSSQIPLELVQSALKSFLDMNTSMPADAKEGIYARPLEVIGTLEVKMNEEEFAEYVFSYIENFTSDMFQDLLKHLFQCANDARETIRHDKQRHIFLQLFLDCDHGKVGLLHRERVLALLENFYNKCSEPARKRFRNPTEWPIIELDDIDLLEFWGDMEDDRRTYSGLRSLFFKTSQLSVEAMMLNEALKDVLSEVTLTVIDAGDNIEVPAVVSPEEAALEQQVSSAGEMTEAIQATASREQAAEDQKEQDQTTMAGASVSIADISTEAIKVGLDRRESNVRPEGLIDTSEEKTALMLEETFDNLDSDKWMLSEEQDTAAQTSFAELASMLDEDFVEGVSLEHLDESTEDQPITGTGEPPAEDATEGQVSGPSSLPSQKANKSFEKAPQLIHGRPWSGDLQTDSLTFMYRDYAKEVQEEWNIKNAGFEELRMNLTELQCRGPPSCLSAFDKHSLNLPQFLQLMETFVGPEITLSSLKKLVEFMKKGYMLLEKEKISQMEKVRHEAFVAHQQLLLAAVFEKWDNEGSGFLDMKEVDAVLSTFKEGMEQESLEKAKLQLPIPQWHPSGVVKLFQKDFQTYIELVISEFTGNEDDALDNVVEFLMISTEKSHTEQLRGAARRKWLRAIQHMALTNGGNIEPVYKAVFKALSRDADAHGNSKKISAYIALLEYNIVFPERGDILLRYVACTEDDAPYVLNQSLYMDMKGVSFSAALDDKPIHVPRVQLHGNIHFWNSDRPKQERRGSFLVIPLEDIRRRVFGILGLDTLHDQNDQTIFVPHEICFYQGVARAFSVAYHSIRTQDTINQMILTAVEWLSGRAPSLHAITAYLMEPGEDNTQDYTLRKVMTTDHERIIEILPHPAPVISRRENIFRDYLFKCTDCAEAVTVCLYQDHHIAFPLRDPAGHARMVFDINLGQHQKLPPCEHKDLQKMLKMVQGGTYEILKENSGDLEPYYVLEAEYVGDWRRGAVLFYRFMLQDLQNCIWNLDPQHSFDDMRRYEEPPPLMHKILKCVVLILYPYWADTEEVEDWDCCIEKLDGELIERMCYFDPTAAHVQVHPVLYKCLKGIHRTEVWKLGSAPVEFLYNWALTCLSLIELGKKLQSTHTVAIGSSGLLISNPVQSSNVSLLSE